MMKRNENLDQRIDSYLKDQKCEPSPDFTATALECLAREKSEKSKEMLPFAWRWLALPLAATIALGFTLHFAEQDGREKKPGLETGASETETIGDKEIPPLLAEMNEVLAMEESLRDLEILLDEDALDILALLDE